MPELASDSGPLVLAWVLAGAGSVNPCGHGFGHVGK